MHVVQSLPDPRVASFVAVLACAPAAVVGARVVPAARWIQRHVHSTLPLSSAGLPTTLLFYRPMGGHGALVWSAVPPVGTTPSATLPPGLSTRAISCIA